MSTNIINLWNNLELILSILALEKYKLIILKNHYTIVIFNVISPYNFEFDWENQLNSKHFKKRQIWYNDKKKSGKEGKIRTYLKSN